MTDEPSYYWWDAHQNYKLNDDMEVCSPSIGDANKHVRVYLHSTFKEFIEERGKLARHVYPELMHLCFERGVAFSPIDLFWQTSSLEEANQPEQVCEAIRPHPSADSPLRPLPLHSSPSLPPSPSALHPWCSPLYSKIKGFTSLGPVVLTRLSCVPHSCITPWRRSTGPTTTSSGSAAATAGYRHRSSSGWRARTGSGSPSSGDNLSTLQTRVVPA